MAGGGAFGGGGGGAPPQLFVGCIFEERVKPAFLALKTFRQVSYLVNSKMDFKKGS